MNRPVVATNFDGRLEIFYWGGPYSGFLHKRQLSPGADEWSDWKTLGTRMKSYPAVIKDASSRLAIFMLNDERKLVCKRQQSLGSEEYTDWTVLRDTAMKSSPAAAANSDDRIEVFCIGDDENVHHLWQTSAGDVTSGNWSSWTAFNSPYMKFESDPFTIPNDNGKIELYAVRKDSVTGTNKGIMRKFQLAPEDYVYNSDGGWSYWSALGVYARDYPLVEISTVANATTIAAIRNKDNRIETFVRGKNSEVWHVWQEQRNAGEYHSYYSNWHTLGGDFTGNPAVGKNRDGRLEVFARGKDGKMYHMWQKTPNGPAWEASWHTMGGAGLKSDPAVGYHSNKTLEVFCWGGDDRLWHRRQTTPNGGWGEWKKESR